MSLASTECSMRSRGRRIFTRFALKTLFLAALPATTPQFWPMGRPVAVRLTQWALAARLVYPESKSVLCRASSTSSFKRSRIGESSQSSASSMSRCSSWNFTETTCATYLTRQPWIRRLGKVRKRLKSQKLRTVRSA